MKAIQVIGVPWDEKSSFMRGCADAPGKIWDAFKCASSNPYTECGKDLSKSGVLRYYGNLMLSSGSIAGAEIEQQSSLSLDRKMTPLYLGGDHAITFPLIKGLSQKYDDLNILHFDAHPDLYDELDGDRYSHGSSFVRILEGGYASRLISVGVRTMNARQQEQADRFGVEIIDMRAFSSTRMPTFKGPVYISIDLDVLDPAFAPGVSHHEPGGLTTRELIGCLQAVKGRVVAADLVEYNPYRDIQNVTAMVAAKLMKELAAKMLESGSLREMI